MTSVRCCSRCRCPGHTAKRCNVFKPSGLEYYEPNGIGDLERQREHVAVEEIRRIRAIGKPAVTEYECIRAWIAKGNDPSRLREGRVSHAARCHEHDRAKILEATQAARLSRARGTTRPRTARPETIRASERPAPTSRNSSPAIGYNDYAEIAEHVFINHSLPDGLEPNSPMWPGNDTARCMVLKALCSLEDTEFGGNALAYPLQRRTQVRRRVWQEYGHIINLMRPPASASSTSTPSPPPARAMSVNEALSRATSAAHFGELLETGNVYLTAPSTPPTPPPAPVVETPEIKVREAAVEETVCAICAENLTECDKYVTPCGHQFHGSCAMKWMQRSNLCATCRVPIIA